MGVLTRVQRYPSPESIAFIHDMPSKLIFLMTFFNPVKENQIERERKFDLWFSFPGYLRTLFNVKFMMRL